MNFTDIKFLIDLDKSFIEKFQPKNFFLHYLNFMEVIDL